MYDDISKISGAGDPRAPSSRSTVGSAEAVAPLVRITERLRGTIVMTEERLSEVCSAGFRVAERVLGEQGPERERERPERASPNYGPPGGFGGQFAELEGEIMRAEALMLDLCRRAENMMNRITQIG